MLEWGLFITTWVLLLINLHFHRLTVRNMKAIDQMIEENQRRFDRIRKYINIDTD